MDRPRPGGIGQIGDRPAIGSGNIGSGNATVNRPQVNVNNVHNNAVNNVSNTFAQSNRVGVGVNNPYGGRYGNGYGWNRGGGWNGYYGGSAWHSGWNAGYWGGGYYNRPAGWYPRAAPLGWLPVAAASTYVYSNPYYVAAPSTVVVGQPVYNYSQPIATPPVEVTAPVDVPVTVNVTAPQVTQAATVPEPDPKTEDVVNADFTAAREAFQKGDYPAAQANAEKAVTAFPNDPSLHEFLGLVLFARGKYPESAGVVYAVLAAQPGWNYDTMRALYPDTETYTKQLRGLEAYQKENPARGDACFLLAYHYLTLEYKDAAVDMLTLAVKNEPKDQLSATLLKALTEPPAGAETK